MLRRMIMAGVVLAVATVPLGASAQSGTNVGGSVPSFLALSLVQPQGFASFPKSTVAHTYTLAISAQVTATDAPLVMTIGDGDYPSGARHGHLVSGSSVLPAPLQVATGSSAWRPLDGPTDPTLDQWPQQITAAPAPIRLRQDVGAGAGPHTGFHKLLLLTLSTQAP
jgi:hypothetical protein